ncbi:MAG: ATP synthase F0 subunit B [Deltaproteobacteria bacterium]|nr:ATP synthase F0 subunit B [Deltaproteobacteria bacterium]
MFLRGEHCQGKRIRLALVFAFLFLAGLAGTSQVLAVEDTAHGETAATGHQEAAGAADHGEDHDSGAMLDLLARFINFALLVIILAVVLKKSNALGFFSDRVQEIRNRMERLQQEKEEAESRYREIRQKLTDFESEKEGILAEARRDGEAEKAKIISEAERRVAQMLEQVETAVQHELEDARGRLREEVAELAADKAREIISRELGEDDQDRLVSEFIEKVGKVH